jgi:hypothetical protein
MTSVDQGLVVETKSATPARIVAFGAFPPRWPSLRNSLPPGFSDEPIGRRYFRLGQ